MQMTRDRTEFKMSMKPPLWRLTTDGATLVASSGFEREATLEQLIETCPELLQDDLLIIGRQVVTSEGRILDLLALDSHAHPTVIEVKRDRLPATAIGQAVSYSAWVAELDREALDAIYATYRAQAHALGADSLTLAAAFHRRFGFRLPSDVRRAPRILFVARSVDTTTFRALQFARRQGLAVDLCLLEKYDSTKETWLTVTRPLAPEDARAQQPVELLRLRSATLDAVEQSTDRLLARLDILFPPTKARTARIRKNKADQDVLCFVLLFLPRFATSFVPYPLLEGLYAWWAKEQASLGVTRLVVGPTFSRELSHAIALTGEWRKARRYWHGDPALEREQMTHLVDGWRLPSDGQHLSGYERISART